MFENRNVYDYFQEIWNNIGVLSVGNILFITVSLMLSTGYERVNTQ